MNEPTENRWGGADVEARDAETERTAGESGTIREDVSAGMPATHEGTDTGLSTADLAGQTARPAEPASGTQAGPIGSTSAGNDQTPLFPESEAQTFRGRWEKLQASFVDDPRTTVQEADGLVAEVMQRLAQTFADERRGLEGQWERGSDVSTEDLRVALQRYRSFFGRLLAV